MFCRTDALIEKRLDFFGQYCRRNEGFTLVELLIAMVLTALIGTVLFSTYIFIADSGVKGRELVQSREAPRIFWGIVDTDLAGIVLSKELPLPSRTPILPSKKWQELTGDSAEPAEGTYLLTFATTSSLSEELEHGLAGPCCVEYVTRQGKNGLALIRRERSFCGVEGDFPWAEAVLLTGLKDVQVRLCSEEKGEWEVPEEKEWYRLGAVQPQAVRISLEYEGTEEPETLFVPFFKGRGNVFK